MAGFEALLFDMDGLLLDSERVACAGFQEAAAPFGIEADVAEAFFLTLVGTSHQHTDDCVSGFLPGVDIGQFNQTWDAACKARYDAHVPVKPGVCETLEVFQAQRVRMAVVTSTRKSLAKHLLIKAGLFDFFEHITGGDEVSANKPDPAPYIETAERLGVDPMRCAAFEDSDRGITAAVRAGCTAVQIPDLRPLDVPLPTLGQHVAKDFSTAMQHLRLL